MYLRIEGRAGIRSPPTAWKFKYIKITDQFPLETILTIGNQNYEKDLIEIQRYLIK